MLLLTFVNMLNVLQMGFNTGLVKYLAGILGQANSEEAEQYVGTSLAIYLSIATPVAIALASFTGWLVPAFFHVPDELRRDIILCFYLAAAAFLLRFVAEVFYAVPIAAQRFDIVNGLFVGCELVRILASVLAVYLGYLVKTVIAVNLCVNLLFLVGSLLSSKYLIPGLRVRPRFSYPHFWRLFHFSKFTAIASFASRIGNNVDVLIVGYFLPVANVSFYSIPAALCSKIWALVGNVTTVSFPAASALSAASPEGKLGELYLRGTKMVTALAAFPAVALCLLSHEILRHWIGIEFASQSSLTLKLMSCAFLINCLMHMPDSLSSGVGHPWIPAKFNVLETTLKFGSFLVLVPHFGIAGAAAGYLGTQVVLTPWFVNAANRVVGVSWRSLLLKSYCPILTPLSLISLFLLSMRPYVTSLHWLILVLFSASAAYMLLGTFLILDSKERTACLALLATLPFRGLASPKVEHLSEVER